ncbi:hypothetical protein SAMN04488583_2323 [Mycobacterium sp. 88mf]|nr:hypothetical protein SAMN04488583_2323 [Mycobacterium sp. 88mf]SFF44690.1 hypothetical protein SAMN04488582_102659 [Mycobacterium sp. 455mf]
MISDAVCVPLEGVGRMEIRHEAVTYPRGVNWTVRRKWMYGPDTAGDSDGVIGTVFTAVVLLVFLAWPFWFVAKFLGVPWTIVIERDGREVGTERVKGWRASERRMDEIRRNILTSGVSQQNPPYPPSRQADRQTSSGYWYR